MTTQAKIMEVVKLLPENDLKILLTVAQRLIPVDVDDIETADDVAAYETALEEYRNGEGIPLEHIAWKE